MLGSETCSIGILPRPLLAKELPAECCRWDAYPVPKTAPAPYNDNTQWGIVPSWGFGIALESHISSLRPGALLFGYWPTASAPVDLKLQASEAHGQWAEVSKHREQVMPVYNQYHEKGYNDLPKTVGLVDLPQDQLNHMAWVSLFGAIWQTGFLLNRHTFTSTPETHVPISPLGNKLPWTKDNADLSQTVLVSFSASGKTARGFAWQVFTKRAGGSNPLAFLQVTQAPDTIRDVASRQARISFGVFDYTQLEKTVDVAAEHKPQRIVVVDFGARGNATRRFLDALNENPELKGIETTIVHVGGEQKVRYLLQPPQATKL